MKPEDKEKILKSNQKKTARKINIFQTGFLRGLKRLMHSSKIDEEKKTTHNLIVWVKTGHNSRSWTLNIQENIMNNFVPRNLTTQLKQTNSLKDNV